MSNLQYVEALIGTERIKNKKELKLHIKDAMGFADRASK